MPAFICPGAIVLYRQGVAWVAYDQDATTLADLIGEKPCRWSEEAPTAFFAFTNSRLDAILKTLVAAGQRVALSEPIVAE